MTKVRDLFLLLPFTLMGGSLAAYSLVMSLFAMDRVYAFLAFSSFLVAGTLLLCLGPAVVRRSS